MRQTSRQKLYGFLNWAVQRGHLKSIYAPPATLLKVLKPKRVGYPLTDAQILQLLDNLPEGEAHDRWRFAIQLCAVYGLSPEALRHLRIKDGANGAELWTIYQKSMGGTKGAKTEPRRYTRCWCVMPMAAPLIGTCRHACKSAKNCRR